MDNFYDYVKHNDHFLKRVYTVNQGVKVQLVQEDPKVYLVFTPTNRAYISNFTHKILILIEQNNSIKDILGLYPDNDDVLDSIAKSVSILIKKSIIIMR
ncbi:hypothetical protein [Streptococcus dysgalactiae]|uniref:hypothetical protein n=1 Tax=Streptococcus dysgalactiae TaxID=1334 RepID=UPI0022B622C3|nr:hypothetical protein [Streptococcus dysgalactiae]